MTPAERAAFAFQSPPHREPARLIGRDVCCHCKRFTTAHRFTTPDGCQIETHHCPEHGDVRPMRSHVVNWNAP